MPWKTDENGNPVYAVSRYVKEELPTWNEVYNEFCKNELFEYNPGDPSHQELDPYWKIPKRKFLLAVVANQFNKMLTEDTDCEAEKAALLRYLRNVYNAEIDWVRFTLCPSNKVFESTEPYRERVHIYTIPNPNGQENPFITSMEDRIDITDYYADDKWTLGVIYHSSEQSLCGIVCEDESGGMFGYDDANNSPEIVEAMIPRFKKYFDNGVGWKDNE